MRIAVSARRFALVRLPKRGFVHHASQAELMNRDMLEIAANADEV